MDRLSIIGLGKLGAPMAACFAARGFTVVGVDLDPEKRAALDLLRPPVSEPGLEELLAASSGRLTTTGSIAEAVAASDATFLVVPTPSEPEGGFSLRYLLEACAETGAALVAKEGYHLVVVTSTVMPGATGAPIREALERASGKRAGEDFGLCYSPEFIALGSVIRDFLEPDFLLVGESDARAGDLLLSIYERTCRNDPQAARTSFVNAELAKLAVNSFVTTKISFANMLAGICDELPEADVDEVTAALGLDSRIGPKYLKGGTAYGGPCFPRDNAALAAAARAAGAHADLAETTDRFNREETRRLRDRVLRHAGAGSTVAVLGLAYKPGTPVVEESAGAALVAELTEMGVDVVAHDPAARPEPPLAECVASADVVVVTTPWPEFRELHDLLRDGQVVIDCWRLLDPSRLDGVLYVAPGKSVAPPARATPAR